MSRTGSEGLHWERRFETSKAYIAEHGFPTTADARINPDARSVREWVGRQNRARKLGKLSQQRSQVIAELIDQTR
ncbi:helicase associated domain-containing protein [Psychromicrobium silvestre]